MQLKFEPLGDKILVQPDDAELITKSGIILPKDSSGNDDLPASGVIVALGKGGTFPGCPDPSAILKVGDRIAFNRYAGRDMEQDKVKFSILHLDAVDGIISNGK